MRGTTVRFVVMILSAVLLALQLFAPTASFAAARHQVRARAAEAQEAVTDKRADGTDMVVSRGEREDPAGPSGPLRTRDRHRAAADSAPEPPALVPLAHDVPAVRARLAPFAALRIASSSTAHTPAALQVFRC